MRLLFLNQFFWPDEAATSQLLTDLVRSIDADHDITVICAASRYAGVRPPHDPAPIANVRRLAGPGFGHGKLAKLSSYASFAIGAIVESLRTKRPAVVVSMTTPPLLGLVGLLLQRLRGSRHIIWEMDLYPDVAVDLGAIRKGGLLDKIVGFFADLPRRHADAIVALGPCMAQRLMDRGIPREKIHVCHNWADGDELSPRPFHRDGRLKVFYSGNFGLAHDFDTLLDALNPLGRDPRFHFAFSGGGPRKQALFDTCQSEGFDSCVFDGFSPRDALGHRFGLCDVGLVLQREETCGSLVPSKTYGIMAAGRPIVFVGPASATPAQLIAQHGIGWHVHNGDADGLASLLRWLQQNPHEVEAAGARAREAFDAHYDSALGIRNVLSVLGLAAPASARNRVRDLHARPAARTA